MSFSTKTITALEFDKIRAMLAACAPTEGAGELALCVVPETDPETVRRRLARTTDARRLTDVKGMPPFGGIRDICGSCDRAEKGAMLAAKELLEVARVLHSTRALVDYNKMNRTFRTSLDEIFERLLPNRTLEEKITRAILSEDMIADEASPALAEVRRKMREANNRIKETLQHFLSGTHAKALQETIVTQRNGRYVVPVKAECKNEIKGLIHDTSASGATIFVEPIAVVEANNELRMLASREEQEIEKVLYDLSAQVSATAESLRLNYQNLTQLAFCFACGELSSRMRGCEPILSDRLIDLRRARHPLIDPKKVVPTDIRLGGECDTLIITGPNTGGKTVALKTLGLFSLMAQAGLHLPTDPESTVRVFDRILVDIGDEQSIEQSLSTFSSHMVNLVSILGEVNERSLCLFDELGAGTDPVEGAALAVAIIEYVRSKGAFCAATTHYTELKTFALQTEGVCNASCEFDITTLRPTYRLIIGTPGKSNAFAISERLGLPAEVIELAKKHIHTDHKQFEQVIEQLEAARLEADRNRAEAERLRAEYERKQTDTERAVAQMRRDAEREIEQEKRKAQQMLESARASSNFIFSQLEKAKKAEAAGHVKEGLEEARRAVRAELRAGEKNVNPVEERIEEPYQLPRALRRGDRVRLIDLGTEATVLELPDAKGMVSVQAGILKTRTPQENLRLMEEESKVFSAGKSTPAANYRAEVNRDFRDEIDLRGMLGDEGWQTVDKYLDEAQVAGFSKVRLIHGKGTGALRNALWQRLKKDPRIKNFRIGQYGEGDGGVTVVELK